jgi:nicotinate-nucleotide adenylyltransferase
VVHVPAVGGEPAVSEATPGGLVGLFGGTFDPVHFGHLRAALEAAEQLEANEMRLLPAGEPPHRDAPLASPGQRLEMLRLAVAGQPRLAVDDREIRRAGPSWMVDTLADLRGEIGATPLVLCVGQDAANGLDRWHDWRRLFELAHIAVLRRPDARDDYHGDLRAEMAARRADRARDLRETPAGRVVSLAITQLDISSTVLRERIAAGRSPAFLLPEAVHGYVREHGLYGSPFFAGARRSG